MAVIPHLSSPPSPAATRIASNSCCCIPRRCATCSVRQTNEALSICSCESSTNRASAKVQPEAAISWLMSCPLTNWTARSWLESCPYTRDGQIGQPATAKVAAAPVISAADPAGAAATLGPTLSAAEAAAAVPPTVLAMMPSSCRCGPKAQP
eukprot:scaffold7017_cov113-Isochrysis_galbana.AAC.3